jgi:hypothetical protein
MCRNRKFSAELRARVKNAPFISPELEAEVGVVVGHIIKAAADPGGCLALTAASTVAFRGVVHTKVNAVVLFCFIDKKIFQNVLPVCWGERFFASGGSEVRGPHAHEQTCSVMCIVGT